MEQKPKLELIGDHVMLDLETMGLSTDAPIIAIGAVLFNESDGIKSSFYANLDLKAEVAAGAIIDPGTVLWWMQQSQEARSSLVGDVLHPTEALNRFADWIPEGSKVWGNGSDFDNTKLTACYNRHGIYQPWKYYNNCCYRTIKNMAPEIQLTRVGTYHNAHDDAKSQALHLIEIISVLR